MGGRAAAGLDHPKGHRWSAVRRRGGLRHAPAPDRLPRRRGDGRARCRAPRAPVRRRGRGALHRRAPRRDDRDRRRGGPAGPCGALEPVPRPARRRGPLVPHARALRGLPPLAAAGGRAPAAPCPRGCLARRRRDGTRGPGPCVRGGRAGPGHPPRHPGGSRRVRGRRAPDARAVGRGAAAEGTGVRPRDRVARGMDPLLHGRPCRWRSDRRAGDGHARRPVGGPGEAARPARACRHDDAPGRRGPGA